MKAAYKWRITKDKYAYITIGTNDGNEQNIIDIILNDESYEKLFECSVGHIEKEQYEFFKNLDSFSL